MPNGLAGVGGWLDDRFHAAKGARVLMKKVFPDHWSFMLGEIALWSFVILLLTGTYLALFFEPSAAPRASGPCCARSFPTTGRSCSARSRCGPS